MYGTLAGAISFDLMDSPPIINDKNPNGALLSAHAIQTRSGKQLISETKFWVLLKAEGPLKIFGPTLC